MKNIFALFIMMILAAGIAHAQDGWVTHKGDERVSVKFPSEPFEQVPGSFMVVSKDSSMAYVFTIVDFLKVAGVDSVALAPVKNTPLFAGQLKTGLMSTLKGVDMTDFTIGNWKGFTSYTGSGADAKKKKYDFFMLLIGNKLYSLTTIRAYNLPADNRDTFFNSVMLSR